MNTGVTFREWGEMEAKTPDVIPAFIAGIQYDAAASMKTRR